MHIPALARWRESWTAEVEALSLPPDTAPREAEAQLETLTRLRWNKSHAAAELGLSRVGLRAKLERYAIDRPGRVASDEDDEEG